MENPPEGKHKNPQQNWPHHEQHAPAPAEPVFANHDSFTQPPVPMPVTPATITAASGAIPAPNHQPSSSHASTLILQWLTYAFWGWTILVLSSLIVSVLLRMVTGEDSSNFNYYVIAGLAVLVPVSVTCDVLYARQEPDRKVGPASLIMIIHAVLFALFGIGSLLFAAWSIVSLIIDHSDSGSNVAYLISTIIIALLYAVTFARTLNPTHLRRLIKIYRFSILGIVVLFVILGFVNLTFSHHKDNSSFGFNDSSSSGSFNSSPGTSSGSENTFDSRGKLEPTVIGGTQCDIGNLNDDSSYAQVAVSGGSTCDTAEAVIKNASGHDGKDYSSNGYTCNATKQGGNTKWSSYWNDNFYSYTCSKSQDDQLAFNLQTSAQATSSPGSPIID